MSSSSDASRRVLLATFFALLALQGCADHQDRSAPPPERWVTGPRAGDRDLLAVAFPDPAHGWVVGDIAPTGGSILFSGDGGHSWRIATQTTEVLAAIWFVTAERGWVAGYGGLIRRTEDGGATWNPLATAREEDLWAVRFASPERGWTVGEGGLILATTDGGATWSVQESGTKKALLGLAVGAEATVVAVGEDGIILRSDDGSRWETVPNLTTESLNAVISHGAGVFRIVGGIDIVLNGFSGAAVSEVADVEPNEKKKKAQKLNAPALVTGHVNENDASKLTIDFGSQGTGSVQDLYVMNLDRDTTFFIMLEGLTENGDIDLYLLDSAFKGKVLPINSGFILATSLSPTTSEFIGVRLPAGKYYLGVSGFSGQIGYQLRVLTTS